VELESHGAKHSHNALSLSFPSNELLACAKLFVKARLVASNYTSRVTRFRRAALERGSDLWQR
jgi:hypothetical protein